MGTNDNAVAKSVLCERLETSEATIDKLVSSVSKKLMAVTVMEGGRKVKVATVSDAEVIVYGGREYLPQRTKSGAIRKQGNNSWWLPSGD